MVILVPLAITGLVAFGSLVWKNNKSTILAKFKK